MKILFIFFLSLPLSAATFIPEGGLYSCQEGNIDSVCDQQLRVITENGKLTALSVMYTGYCNGQGPYRYPCFGQTCTDGVIKISFISETKYTWNNLPHDIHCRMVKFKKISH
jgi:hypothetical protein